MVARDTDFVRSLERGLAVIRAFDGDNPALTLSDVARITGLTRAAARRFVLTLVDVGYIVEEYRLFRLAPRVLELGRPYIASLSFLEPALPHLREATAELRESCSLAVLDDPDIVYVAHVPAKRSLSISVSIGSRDPAYATALGRVLLANQTDARLEPYLGAVALEPLTERTVVAAEELRQELLRVRRQGWSYVDQELEEGLRVVAAPIHDPDGRVVAACNVAVHASRWTVKTIRETLVPRILKAAAAIDGDIRGGRAESRSHAERALEPHVGKLGGPADGGAPRASGVAARDADLVQSLERGIAVVRAFTPDNPALTQSDVARRSGLTRAAVRRFLGTLSELGYVRMEGRRYQLSARVLELGRPYLSNLTLAELALPHLRQLTDAVGEPSSVALLDGSDIVYVAHVASKHILAVSVQVGTRDPAAPTALGRVLLAGQDAARLDRYLATVRLPSYMPRTIATADKLRAELRVVDRQGWSLVDQEFEEGLRALAVPICDAQGNVAAAANLAVHTSRWSVDAIRTMLLPELQATARAIERDLWASN